MSGNQGVQPGHAGTEFVNRPESEMLTIEFEIGPALAVRCVYGQNTPAQIRIRMQHLMKKGGKLAFMVNNRIFTEKWCFHRLVKIIDLSKNAIFMSQQIRQVGSPDLITTALKIEEVDFQNIHLMDTFAKYPSAETLPRSVDGYK